MHGHLLATKNQFHAEKQGKQCIGMIHGHGNGDLGCQIAMGFGGFFHSLILYN